MACKVRVVRGSKENDEKTFEFTNKDINVTDFRKSEFFSVSDLRTRLMQENFITAETDGKDSVWKFLYSYVETSGSETIEYEERFVPLSSEKHCWIMDIATFANHDQEIIVMITNTNRDGLPDLMGFATDYFNNGKIKVRCRLRMNMEKDHELNAGKFEPLMLTNVMSTRESDSIEYKFACVCCEDSVIEFPVESFGTVGINLKAEINNEIIYDCCFAWAPYVHDITGHVSVNCFSTIKDGKRETRNLVVKNIYNDKSIVPGTEIHYQKIRIYTHDVLEWYDKDQKKTYDRNSVDPTSHVSAALQSVDSLQGLSKINSAEKQIDLPGGSVAPGTISKGDEVTFGYGRRSITKISEAILGAVDIYMFVFNTLEDAKRVIGRYNRMTESEQSHFWKGVR